MADSLEDFTPEEAAAMADAYRRLISNPETRELTLRATKKINPSASIPEIELKDQARAAFSESNKKIESLEQQIRERDARDRVRDHRGNLRDQGFNNDDVAAIEKLMMDEQIPSYETAAKYYKSQRQMATPTPTQGRAMTYELPSSPMSAFKSGGNTGLKNWARSEASAALDDIRSGRIKLQ